MSMITLFEYTWNIQQLINLRRFRLNAESKSGEEFGKKPLQFLQKIYGALQLFLNVWFCLCLLPFFVIFFFFLLIIFGIVYCIGYVFMEINELLKWIELCSCCNVGLMSRLREERVYSLTRFMSLRRCKNITQICLKHFSRVPATFQKIHLDRFVLWLHLN